MNRTDAELVRWLQEAIPDQAEALDLPEPIEKPLTWMERMCLELVRQDLLAQHGGCVSWEEVSDTAGRLGMGVSEVLPPAWQTIGGQVEIARGLRGSVVVVRNQRSAEVELRYEDIKAWVAGERRRPDGITKRVKRRT